MSGRREERRKTAVSLYSCRGGEGGRGGPSTADSECWREKDGKKNVNPITLLFIPQGPIM